jgi:hypothetical protein
MVMLLISASTRLSQDAALSSARTEQQQLALSHAELLLQQASKDLLFRTDTKQAIESNPLGLEGLHANAGSVHAENQLQMQEHLGNTPASALSVAYLNVAEHAELSDLPLQVVRITAVGKYASVRVRLQADYAIDQCAAESDADDYTDNHINDQTNTNNIFNTSTNDTCHGRIRRIAWRRLPD